MPRFAAAGKPKNPHREYDVIKECNKYILEGAALCKRIGSPAYDTWIEAMITLNDRYQGATPYKAVDLIAKAYPRTWADLCTWISSRRRIDGAISGKSTLHRAGFRGSLDPSGQGRVTLVPKVSRPLRKPPPKNRLGATGESFRSYRRIA